LALLIALAALIYSGNPARIRLEKIGSLVGRLRAAFTRLRR
jgi:hypothetical protein